MQAFAEEQCRDAAHDQCEGHQAQIAAALHLGQAEHFARQLGQDDLHRPGHGVGDDGREDQLRQQRVGADGGEALAQFHEHALPGAVAAPGAGAQQQQRGGDEQPHARGEYSGPARLASHHADHHGREAEADQHLQVEDDGGGPQLGRRRDLPQRGQPRGADEGPRQATEEGREQRPGNAGFGAGTNVGPPQAGQTEQEQHLRGMDYPRRRNPVAEHAGEPAEDDRGAEGQPEADARQQVGADLLLQVEDDAVIDQMPAGEGQQARKVEGGHGYSAIAASAPSASAACPRSSSSGTKRQSDRPCRPAKTRRRE